MAEGVVRAGDTVGRPPAPNAQLARDVLLHLERAGFDAAPRWLGREDAGRDVYDLAEERCRENGRHRQLAPLPAERAWLARNRQLLAREPGQA